MAKKREMKKRKRTAILSCLIFTKSTMESIIESIAPLWGFYSDFCSETTLHGLRHTVEPKLHFLERLLWIVLSISAFAGAVFCALSQFSRFTQEPVVVSLQRAFITICVSSRGCYAGCLVASRSSCYDGHFVACKRLQRTSCLMLRSRSNCYDQGWDYRRWQTTFPAVTACFLERINPEKAKEAIEKHWNVTEESDPDRFQYYTEFLELVTDVSFRENLQNFWKYQDDITVGGINLLQLALSVHPVAELSVRMSHTDKEVTWHAVMTEMGMCLSINSEYAEYQHMTDAEWSQEELLSCHYLSGQCYVRIDSIDNAIRFFIHSPFEIATAVSNPTGEIAPGEELIIDFKAVEIQAAASVRALTTEQRRCRYHDEWISPSIKVFDEIQTRLREDFDNAVGEGPPETQNNQNQKSLYL